MRWNPVDVRHRQARRNECRTSCGKGQADQIREMHEGRGLLEALDENDILKVFE